MTTLFRHDPAAVRRWATEHGIEVADAPEPAPGEPGAEPAPGEPEFTGYLRDARVAQAASDYETAIVARRVTRLTREAADLETAIARLRDQAGPLADQVARLTREADQLDQRIRFTRASSARQAAEDERAAALARRVAQVLEGDRELDPFTSALAALAQHKRRLTESPDDDPELDEPDELTEAAQEAAERRARLAELAEAVREAAVRRARVIQLQHRQITVNRNRGPDSPEAAAVRRELAAERLAMVVLATLGSGLDSDGILSVVLTGSLPGNGGLPRFLTDPDWPVTG